MHGLGFQIVIMLGLDSLLLVLSISPSHIYHSLHIVSLTILFRRGQDEGVSSLIPSSYLAISSILFSLNKIFVHEQKCEISMEQGVCVVLDIANKHQSIFNYNMARLSDKTQEN